ncbi:MAG: M48 family metallopeptidase [Deltaproteobacteria bacterium]|nr:M48 family metallopeptidase [Deltaproteobacteria bacterium]
MNQLELIFERLTPFLSRKPPQKTKYYTPLFIPRSTFIPQARQKFDFTFEIKKQKTVSYQQDQIQIHFYGPVHHRKKLQSGMRKFFIDQSRRFLFPKVQHYAQATGLQYRAVRFKNQKSLWGSCSDLKNINFNIRLLFLPDELIDYVIIHELCHLIHMNHSKAFWQLVETHCQNYKHLEAQLHQANRYVPKWLFAL